MITNLRKEVSKMKQKYIYIVLNGIVDGTNPLSGAHWLDEQARFSNLKDASKYFNSIKHATNWNALWSCTTIERIRVEDIEAYDNGDFGDTEELKTYYQPQRYNGSIYKNKPFER